MGVERVPLPFLSKKMAYIDLTIKKKRFSNNAWFSLFLSCFFLFSFGGKYSRHNKVSKKKKKRKIKNQKKKVEEKREKIYFAFVLVPKTL